jgi:hypothetical protein
VVKGRVPLPERGTENFYDRGTSAFVYKQLSGSERSVRPSYQLSTEARSRVFDEIEDFYNPHMGAGHLIASFR